MKQWIKTLGMAAMAMAICAATILLFWRPKECCLCNIPSYCAPCLIDLNTGNILELNLDGPSTTHTPDNGQSDVETFSFIRFGNITGTKQTAPDGIELKILTEDKMKLPALCRKCRHLLPRGYDARYILADPDSKDLFPITSEVKLSIRNYQITVIQNEEHIYLVTSQILYILHNAVFELYAFKHTFKCVQFVRCYKLCVAAKFPIANGLTILYIFDMSRQHPRCCHGSFFIRAVTYRVEQHLPPYEISGRTRRIWVAILIDLRYAIGRRWRR